MLNLPMTDLDTMIARYGWVVQGVFDVDGKQPSFAYTIGLAAKGQPEIIVFGLPAKLMHLFLNMLGRRFVRDGVPQLDVDLDDVADGLPARLVPVPRAVADSYMVDTLARHPDYTAVQMVWCDRNGRFPWDAGCDTALIKAQPVLRGVAH
jgi:hypothetical protein